MSSPLSLPLFENENISGPLFRLAIALIVLQTLAIGLHFSARLLKLSTGGSETWFLLAGYVFNVAFAALIICKFKPTHSPNNRRRMLSAANKLVL